MDTFNPYSEDKKKEEDKNEYAAGQEIFTTYESMGHKKQ